jgi:hypothetical protein
MKMSKSSIWEIDLEKRKYFDAIEDALEDLADEIGFSFKLKSVSRFGSRYWELNKRRKSPLRIRVSDHGTRRESFDFSFSGDRDNLQEDLKLCRAWLHELWGKGR